MHDMDQSSDSPDARARRIAATICKALGQPGKGVAVAAATGVSDSTISRLKTDHLDTFSKVLAHLGLKVVPIEMKCYEPDQIAAVFTMAKAYMKTIDTPEKLQFDD